MTTSTIRVARKILILNGVDKFHHCVAVGFGEGTELLDRATGVALAVAVPHDGLDHVACTTVVQAVGVARADGSKAAAPKRGGAAPTGTDVVLHIEAVLHEVAVRPYFLVRVAGQARVAVDEEVGWVGEVVVAGLPAGAVAEGAANLTEQLAAALDVSYAYLTDDDQTDPSFGEEKNDYIETAHALYGVKGAREIEQLLDANRALFAGGALSQDEKNAFFDAVMDAYLTSKKEARRRFSPVQSADGD